MMALSDSVLEADGLSTTHDYSDSSSPHSIVDRPDHYYDYSSPQASAVFACNGKVKGDSHHEPETTASSGNRQTIKKGQRNLTPAQLAKKRASDRDAQRAIRKRTRHQIETLEATVRKLESGDGRQELQKLLREKNALQAELDEMKRRFAAILEIVKPMVIPSDSKNDILHVDSRTEADGPRRGARFWSTATIQTDLQSIDEQQNGIASEPSKVESPATLASLTSNYATPLSRTDTQLSMLTQGGSSGQQLEPLQPSPANNDSFYKPDTSWSHPFDPIVSPHPSTNRLLCKAPASLHDSMRFSQLPINIRPTCHFDTILHDFVTHTRQRGLSEQSLREMLGSPQPDYTPLVDSRKRSSDDSSELTNLLIDLLKGFSALSGWPEKVAIISHMFFLMRWVLCPTPENFELIPQALKPLDIQIKLAHPIWVDFIPWRRMRQRMVYDYVCVSLDDFFMPYTTTLSMNWWSDDLLSCVYYDSATGKTLIRPEFEIHKNEEDHWTLGKHFEETLPNLANTCVIREKHK